jgi:N-acetylmuramoyl-L-alanine amidase
MHCYHVRSRFFALLIWLLAGIGSLCAQSTADALRLAPFLEYTATTGDDVTIILERYKLADVECNVTQFFKLNRLKRNDYRLIRGKTYKLPIQVVQYNGKSIRTTLGIEDFAAAKRIDNYNKWAKKAQLRDDNFIESKNLWVPWNEVNCTEVAMASAGTKPTNTPTAATGVQGFGGEQGTGKDKRTFAIFGSGSAHTPLISNKLRGKVFYLISGHGGPDPGAQGKRSGKTLCEDEYAYDVTLRLLKFLLSHGATAYMIVRDQNDGIRNGIHLPCDQDEVVWGNKAIPRDQKERLAQRTEVINALSEQHRKKGQKDQTVIEIHVDSRSKATETDVFFYYRSDSEASQALAFKIHEIFIEKYREKRGSSKTYTGTVSTRDLWTLRETTPQKAVYIELANIQNSWDQQRIVLNNNRQAIANWIGQALLR